MANQWMRIAVSGLVVSGLLVASTASANEALQGTKNPSVIEGASPVEPSVDVVPAETPVVAPVAAAAEPTPVEAGTAADDVAAVAPVQPLVESATPSSSNTCEGRRPASGRMRAWADPMYRFDCATPYQVLQSNR
jgi:hypothetical protein